MSANPSQLFLLADHIKLSLLERQRAKSLNIPAGKQDASITRSLVSFEDGLQAIENEVQTTPDSTLQDQLAQLRKQYDELSLQFRGSSGSDELSGSPNLTRPNDPALAADFDAALSVPQSKSRNTRGRQPYRDDPNEEEDRRNEAARNELFHGSGNGSGSGSGSGSGNATYRDELSPAQTPEPDDLSNEQIHVQHSQIIAEQDEQLDRLGVSIGRQRELSMRIGDELDEQVAMLEDVEGGVDRHQSRLDGARDRLGRFARKAKGWDWSWYVIGGLILILIILIVILK